MNKAFFARFLSTPRLTFSLVYGLLAVAGFCALLLILPYLIPLQRVQQAAAIKISSLTGQDVTFSGAARRFGFPLPVFTLRNVQISGSTNGPALLRAPRIDARLNLPSLLSGNIEVSGLSVIEPKIDLHTDAQGRSNWQNGASLLVLFDPREIAPQGSLPPSLRIGEVSLADGTITYSRDGSSARSKLSAVNVTLYWPDVAKRFAVQGSMLREGQPLRFSALLRKPAALFKQDISPFELVLDTPALKAELTGEIFAAPHLQAEGALTLTSPSLRDLAGWSLPNAESIPEVGKISATAKLHLKDRGLLLDEAKIGIGGSRAEGYLAFRTNDARPTMQGTLDFDTVDLRPFLAAQLGDLLSAQNWGTQGIKGENLSALDMDLRASAKKLLFGKTQIEDAALSVLTRGNRVELSLGDGKLYDGQMAGRLVVESREGGGIKTYGTLSLMDIRVDNALRESLDIVSLTGTGEISLNLAGEGASLRDIAQSLQGEARLRLQDGSLAGIDMAALMRRAKSNPVEAFLEARRGQTEIESAIARFTIKDGAATTNDAAFQGPDYRANLNGRAFFSERAFDMKGAVRPPQNVQPAFELPFAVRGPWDNPIILPNPDALVQPAATPANESH